MQDKLNVRVLERSPLVGDAFRQYLFAYPSKMEKMMPFLLLTNTP